MKHLIFLVTAIWSFTGMAQNSVLFESANQAYAEGDYNKAASEYQRILESGETSAAVHYNLANSYYKLDRVAPSIYHYEKALILNPGDEDVRNNLGFARKMAIDALGTEGEDGLRGFFERSTALFSPTGWGWLAVSFMVVFIILFLAYYFSYRSTIKRILFICSIIFLLLSVSSATIGFTRNNLNQNNNFAIVFSEEVEVKSEPSVRSGEVFRLHEGAKVKITEDFQDWVEIELPNGTQGWLEKTNLKKL